MNCIIEVIGQELSELSALELENLPYFDFVYTVASTNIKQSAPNLVNMYMIIRSWMSLIMGLIRPELSELFALEFAKIAESDFVLHSSIYKCRPICTKHGHNIYMTVRCQMCSILGQIRQ